MLSGLSILIVEDDEFNIRLLEMLLGHNNATLDIARDGKEAVAKLAEQSYDAAIIDLALPEMNGWELLRHIKANNLDLPCVALTAYHDSRVMHDAKKAGFTAYFSKPIETATFARQLATIINS